MSKELRKTEAFARIAAALFAWLFLLPSFAAAQSMPLEDKAKYERSLETKAEEILLKLLGPNQAKVVVQATMDFTKTEKFDVTPVSKTPADKGGAFKWEGAASGPANNYLLPGFPTLDPGQAETQSYQKQMLYPASFVKRLNVSVIVNRSMSEVEIQGVKTVLAEILGLNETRGDELSIIKTQFAPFWKTIWYSPESLNLVFKYGILSLMGIVAMIVVSIGFLKLAAAMSSMARAQQSHQITMDLAGAPAGPAALKDLEGAPAAASGPAGGREEPPPQDAIVFNIRSEQAGFLVDIMTSEDPANVAIVASHLAPAVRREFLRLLPPEFSAEVIAQLVKVRFVDPDAIRTIGDELERRLSGALGGVRQVAEVIGGASLHAKREMLEKLSRRDPAAAQEVRKQVFLPEDLDSLSERDLSVLLGNFKIETLAAALWELQPALKDKIRKQMAEKAWQMVEQTMKYGAPSREVCEGAVDELLQAALKLMREGRISDPYNKAAAAQAAPPPPAPGTEAIEFSTPAGEPRRQG